jgi:hypothetical protein
MVSEIDVSGLNDTPCSYNKKIITTKKNNVGLKNESLTNHLESLTNHSTTNNESIKKYKCSYCNYSSEYKQNYNRHYKKCSIRLKSDKDSNEEFNKIKNDLESKDKQISILTNTINELKKQTKLDILTTENRLLKEQTKSVSNTTICNTNNNIQNITQYIINTFPNAPNVKPINKIENIDKYLNIAPSESYSSLIHDYYIKDIEPEDRSLWLVDSSRDKYLTRLNDNWQVDVNGEEFCKVVNNALSKALFNKKEEIKDYKEHMSLVLLELLIYVGGQTKLPKKQKSQFLIQNIKNWKELKKMNEKSNSNL